MNMEYETSSRINSLISNYTFGRSHVSLSLGLNFELQRANGMLNVGTGRLYSGPARQQPASGAFVLHHLQKQKGGFLLAAWLAQSKVSTMLLQFFQTDELNNVATKRASEPVFHRREIKIAERIPAGSVKSHGHQHPDCDKSLDLLHLLDNSALSGFPGTWKK